MRLMAKECILQSICKGWGTTLINELCIKEVRSRVKESSNARMYPTTAWHTLASSKLMERFGRRHRSMLVAYVLIVIVFLVVFVFH